MDTQASSALVRQAWEYIATGDFQAFLALLDDDVEWIIPDMPEVPFAGTCRGREQVAHFFHAVDAAQETIEFKPDTFIAQEDKVVVLGRFTNRVKATSRLSRSTWAQVWTTENGRIVSMQEFVDTLAVNSAFAIDG